MVNSANIVPVRSTPTELKFCKIKPKGFGCIIVNNNINDIEVYKNKLLFLKNSFLFLLISNISLVIIDMGIMLIKKTGLKIEILKKNNDKNECHAELKPNLSSRFANPNTVL
tara:strand:+ start:58 stop:393 length:336 start_codon:yes stop_codon:yes gene_type:complete